MSSIRYYSARRRRAMYLGDDIHPLAVYEAHGWICHICQEDIDRALRHPHPKSATLDHVVELCNGGTHTWDNVVPAHKDCNERRSLLREH